MDLLIKNCIFSLAVIINLTACAKLLPPASKIIENQTTLTPNEGTNTVALNGTFSLRDGSTANLNELSKEPLVIFFISETCASCREETSELIARIEKDGLPKKVKLISVLIGSAPEDVDPWIETFNNKKIDWLLGTDLDLKLYKSYFAELKTPSILYFNPNTNTIKKLQLKTTINQLEQETTPWY